MGIWFFSAIFIAFFSGIIFMYSGDRIGDPARLPTQYAALVASCHRAGTAEARGNPTLGAAGVEVRNCTSVGAGALTNSLAQGINVPVVTVSFQPATNAGYMAGRLVITSVPPATAVGGVEFNQIAAHVQALYRGDPSAGIVQANAPFPEIRSGSAPVSVPATITAGTLAIVTNINP